MASSAHLAILEATPDGLVVADRTGRIVMVNVEAERMFGWGRKQLVGQPVEVLVPARFRDRHPGKRASYLEQPRARPMGSGLQLYGLRADGSEFPVEISLSPIDVGGEVWVVSAVRDVSARKEAESRLQHMKDDLTNMVVHDLKNPVTGILMTVQLAMRKAAGLPDVHRRYFEQIARTSREMMRLIVNLLDISKLEEGKMPIVLEPVIVADVAQDVAHEYEPVAGQMGKAIVVDVQQGLPPVVADPTLLKRVLTNLVVNSLRHSGSREVRVDALASPADGTIAIHVIDHGGGIPVDQQATIFEKFGSAQHSRTGDAVSDTGLGLPFCKLAVEEMGGRIVLRSEPGEGSVFAVTLPMQGAAAASAAGASESEAGSAPAGAAR